MAEVAKARDPLEAMAAAGIAFDREMLLLAAEELQGVEKAKEKVLHWPLANLRELAEELEVEKLRRRRGGKAKPVNSRRFILACPFSQGASSYYAKLGALEPRALPPLPPLDGDGVVGS